MVNNRKHVLIICPFVKPNIGGVESHIAKLINYAVFKDYYVTVLTYQPLTVKAMGLALEKHEHYEIHRVRWFGNGWFNKLEHYFPLAFAYLFPGLFLKSLFFYFKNHKSIDCIHAHGLASAVIAVILKFIHKKRIVVSTHAVYNFHNRKLLQIIIKSVLINFDTILAVSEVSKDELIRMGIDSDKVKVHPNWIETDKFVIKDRLVAKAQLNITSKVNFLFLARLIESKGILLFLDAAKEFKDYGFCIVGTGPLSEYVSTIAKEYRNIHFYGILNQENPEEFNIIVNLYNACDYFVSPYLYDEGFSSSLIESVSCGTKVIIPNRGSPPTFLSKDVCLFLSRLTNSKELVDVIKQIDDKINYDRALVRDLAVKNLGEKNADIIISSYE